jgi:hypothetical protein
MGLIDRDHVLVDVLVVQVVQVAVVQVVDVIIVTHGGVAATRSMLVRMGALMDLVGHALTIRRRASLGKAGFIVW